MGKAIEPIPSEARVVAPENDPQHPAHKAVLLTEVIGDHDTDFLIQPFDDRIFISVSQVGKFGTIVRCTVTCSTLSGALLFHHENGHASFQSSVFKLIETRDDFALTRRLYFCDDCALRSDRSLQKWKQQLAVIRHSALLSSLGSAMR